MRNLMVCAAASVPLWFLTAASALACVGSDCPYGPMVAAHWSQGSLREQRGDYAGAVQQYRLALRAAATMDRSDLNDDQEQLLRACAKQGSRVRIRAARAGADVLAALRRKPTEADLAQAARVSAQAFENAQAEFDRQQPELTSACP